jgi:glyoxalase/bleomycin resistance protein/dioxygenase superfamily protein
MAGPHELLTNDRAKLCNSTTVFLVGNIEPTMEWYKRLGFESDYYPPGFAILRRDDIQIFLQQQSGYTAPDDPGRRERHAWNLYIITNDVRALFEEYSSSGVKISRQPCPQDYGMMEFDVMDLNGHRLVFAQPLPRE